MCECYNGGGIHFDGVTARLICYCILFHCLLFIKSNIIFIHDRTTRQLRKVSIVRSITQNSKMAWQVKLCDPLVTYGPRLTSRCCPAWGLSLLCCLTACCGWAVWLDYNIGILSLLLSSSSSSSSLSLSLGLSAMYVWWRHGVYVPLSSDLHLQRISGHKDRTDSTELMKRRD